ncbi:vWA domain-containing protein [Xanthobacteraceae bacterium A53D]
MTGTYDDTAGPIPDIYTPDDNFAERVPCVLLLDGSASMNKADKIGQLNAALAAFHLDLMADPLAAVSVRTKIIRFGDEAAETIHDWCEAPLFRPPTLKGSGRTPLGSGLAMAMGDIAEEKASLRARGINIRRPWLFVLTDGTPTDRWEQVAARCREAQTRGAFFLWPIGIGPDANFEVLQQLTPDGFALEVGETRFRDLFRWISDSMRMSGPALTDNRAAAAAPDDLFTVRD